MLKNLFCLAFVFISIQSAAVNYYVSPAGNDRNSGKYPSAPWQTLGKVNATNFKPGDHILFLKGSAWKGKVIIRSSGTISRPILWGAYGSGSDPVISGFIAASRWKDAGNGIWTYTNPTLGSSVPGTVTINGMGRPPARFPKSNNFFITSHAGSTSITCDKMVSLPSFAGGEIVIRENHWSLGRGTVTAQSHSTVTYTSTSAYTPIDGYPFFFRNHIHCLSQFGDWCYDTHSNTISMYFGKDHSPLNYKIKIGGQGPLVYFVDGISNNKFRNLNLEGGDYAFRGANNKYINIDHCTIHEIGHDGIFFAGADHLKISENDIYNCNNDAISCWSGSNNSVIFSNRITNAGMIPGAGENDTGLGSSGAYTGIYIAGDSNILQLNKIRHSGYNGIEADGDHYLIDKNLVDSSCSVVDDGGGIYTYTGARPKLFKERIISNNIVMNTLGSPPAEKQANQGNGIYLDDNSSNTVVKGNSVVHCGQNGYFFHNCHEIRFESNLAYDNAFAQLLFQYDDLVPALTGMSKNMTIWDNTLISGKRGQLALVFESFGKGSSESDFRNFGKADYNHYSSLSSETLIINRRLEPSGFSCTTDLLAWRSASQQDMHSAFLARTPLSVWFQYNATTEKRLFPLGRDQIDMENRCYSGRVSINPFASMVLIDVGTTCRSQKLR